MATKWMEIARKYLAQDIKERRGGEHPDIVRFFEEIDKPEFDEDEVPWCAAFVGACLYEANMGHNGSALAIDYLKWKGANKVWESGGVRKLVKEGDIMVKEGHVTFFVKDNGDGTFDGLGGNQSDAVTVARHRWDDNWAAMRPNGKGTPKLPKKAPSKPAPTTIKIVSGINPLVVDLSHHDDVTSFEEAYKFGIRGVIHKATEGTTFVDEKYAQRRKDATKANLIWGAYHFFRPGKIGEQVEFFLEHAAPLPGTLLALDHEDPACSVADVEQFIRLLEQSTSQKIVLYSGHLIKEQLGNQVHPYLKGTRLWLAQYGSTAVIQATWDDYWLWQFTGDGVGPGPHDVPGLGQNIDINSFAGTTEDLYDQWAERRPDMATPVPMPSKSKNEIVTWGQASLNFLGATPGLKMDGHLGPLTRKALMEFQTLSGIPATGEFDSDAVASLCHKVVEWSADRR